MAQLRGQSHGQAAGPSAADQRLLIFLSRPFPFIDFLGLSTCVVLVVRGHFVPFDSFLASCYFLSLVCSVTMTVSY